LFLLNFAFERRNVYLLKMISHFVMPLNHWCWNTKLCFSYSFPGMSMSNWRNKNAG